MLSSKQVTLNCRTFQNNHMVMTQTYIKNQRIMSNPHHPSYNYYHCQVRIEEITTT